MISPETDLDIWPKKMREIKIKELFEIKPAKCCNRLTPGKTPVITSTSKNNGVGDYASEKPTENGNVITFSDTTAGEKTMFYQPTPFIGTPHVQVMHPLFEMDESIALYLVAAMRKALEKDRYDFHHKMSRARVEETTIRIPEPTEMRAYVTERQVLLKKKMELKKTEICTPSTLPSEQVEWKNFIIEELFEVSTSRGINLVNIQFGGDTLFVGRSKEEYGVLGRIHLQSFPPNEAEMFSIVQIGENVARWREEEWYSSQNVLKLVPKDNEMKTAFLFVQACLDKALACYSGTYQHYPTVKGLKKMQITLPACENRPDWEYMKQVMDMRTRRLIDKLREKKNEK